MTLGGRRYVHLCHIFRDPGLSNLLELASRLLVEKVKPRVAPDPSSSCIHIEFVQICDVVVLTAEGRPVTS